MPRATLDKSRCQGHARCTLEAPDLFDIDDEGKVELLVSGNLTAHAIEGLDNALLACPEGAISKSE